MSLTCRVIPFENCTFTPQLPEGCDLRGERILLHCCCAPCSTAIIEWMVSQGLRPAVFFSNSNIVPIEEYELRRSELERYCKSFGLEVIDDEYNHSAWLETLCGNLGTDPAGLAGIPERGPRCLECFRFRLVRAASYAAENGYTILTTTLASSRWKDLAQVDIAGKYACSSVTPEPTYTVLRDIQPDLLRLRILRAARLIISCKGQTSLNPIRTSRHRRLRSHTTIA